MSLFDPSDFNGDGQTNYVDYQIYKNYIDPQSSQYQGNLFQQTPKTYYPRQKSGLTFTDYAVLMGVFFVLFFIIMGTPLSESPELATIVLIAIWLVCFVVYFNKKEKKGAPVSLEVEQKKQDDSIVSEGEWKCSNCGKVHYGYETSCSCGKSKLDVSEKPSVKEDTGKKITSASKPLICKYYREKSGVCGNSWLDNYYTPCTNPEVCKYRER